MNLQEYYKVKLLEKLNLHEKQEKPWLDSLNLDTMTDEDHSNQLEYFNARKIGLDTDLNSVRTGSPSSGEYNLISGNYIVKGSPADTSVMDQLDPKRRLNYETPSQIMRDPIGLKKIKSAITPIFDPEKNFHIDNPESRRDEKSLMRQKIGEFRRDLRVSPVNLSSSPSEIAKVVPEFDSNYPLDRGESKLNARLRDPAPMTSDQIENELRTKMQNLINDRDAYINRLKNIKNQSKVT